MGGGGGAKNVDIKIYINIYIYIHIYIYINIYIYIYIYIYILILSFDARYKMQQYIKVFTLVKRLQLPLHYIITLYIIANNFWANYSYVVQHIRLF